MSVDIDWEKITAGSDGRALADSIRDFIHDKFQQVTLPKFINAVNVHSFEFGSTCPVVEIKDICDPLPDFYDDEDDSDGEKDPLNEVKHGSSHEDDRHATKSDDRTQGSRTADIQRSSGHSRTESSVTGLGSPFLSHGPNSVGITGGTSNMGYFHFPMSGMPGSQTPLAAVAGGGAFAQAWLNDQQNRTFNLHERAPQRSRRSSRRDSSIDRPQTAGSISSSDVGSSMERGSNSGTVDRKSKSGRKLTSDTLSGQLTPPTEQSQPSDLQIVARVTYDGDVKMKLTAHILLDYPMPSFVNIPLTLSVTGMKFDGVGILAYIKKSMHFCFLDPEDAETLIGGTMHAEELSQTEKSNKKSAFGGLLQEIHVETEIGRQDGGKHGLKNVAKVEQFVLEQVRQIFEEEFVFPSFWTFLV